MNEQVKKIIGEILDVDAAGIADDALIVDDLGADSIAVMEIVMELESAYGFEVPTDAIPSLKTVNDIIAYINANQA